MPRGKKADNTADESQNKVEQEVLDDNPTPSRKRQSTAGIEKRAFVKLHNARTGMTQDIPGATAAKLISKDPNNFKIAE